MTSYQTEKFCNVACVVLFRVSYIIVQVFSHATCNPDKVNPFSRQNPKDDKAKINKSARNNVIAVKMYVYIESQQHVLHLGNTGMQDA